MHRLIPTLTAFFAILAMKLHAQGVQREIWFHQWGSFHQFTTADRFPNNLEVDSNWTGPLNFTDIGEVYGQRIRGSVVPPVSGRWRFWISGDDDAELWLSPSWKSSEKRRIAYLSSWGLPQMFDAHGSQCSEAQNLQAGVPYYFEILHKEHWGGDHVAVAWAYESENWARSSHGTTATQSSIGWGGDPMRALDGNTEGHWLSSTTTHTENHPDSWWQLDFGQDRTINRVVLWNRYDSNLGTRLSNFRISVTDSSGAEVAGQNFFPPGGGHMGNSMVWDLPQSVSARRIKVSFLGWNNDGNGYLSLAEVQAYEAHSANVRQVVPASALQAMTPDPADANQNSLNDAWETQYGLTHASGNGMPASEYADPDGDTMNNLQESQQGSHPLQPSPVPGRLLHERWDGIMSYYVDDLVRHHSYFQPAHSTHLLSPDQLIYPGIYFGTRTRGYLKPQQSGYHSFWISGRNSVELWMATDTTRGKYSKRLIAAIDPKNGTGHGIDWASGNLWDQFAGQQSQPIYLDANKSYYFEIVQQNGHGGNAHSLMAWARHGDPRSMLPASVVSSYQKTSDDLDDDYLPDAWENQYGLDANDNGRVDPAHQGERGDYDSDGLHNRLEYLLGTDPTNADTDGDGLPDLQEVYNYQTSPTTSDFLPSSEVAKIQAISDLLHSSFWSISGSRLISTSYRNQASWKFQVPESGVFQLEVHLGMPIALVNHALTSLTAHVDNMFAGEYEVRFGQDNRAKVIIPLPFLPAGNHELKLSMIGLKSIGTVSIESFILTKQGGADLDGDGMADLEREKRSARSKTIAQSGDTYLSPYVLEGFAPDLATLSVQANGTPVTPQRGVGKYGWKAEVELSDTPLNVVTSFEGGAWSEQRTLIWRTLDLTESHALLARQGDTLKFSIPSHADSKVEILTPQSVKSQIALVSLTGKYQFTESGKYTLRWLDAQGIRSTTTIQVHPRNFSGNLPSAIQGRIRELTPSHDTRGATMDGGNALFIHHQTDLPNGQKLLLSSSASGTLQLGFRDPTTGRLLGLLPIDVIAYSDALGSSDYSSFASGVPQLLGTTYRMAFSDLPDGWTVEVSIFRAGVTFRDGTIEKTFRKSDMPNGILSLEMLNPTDLVGGLCHRFTIRDASGRAVW